MTSKTSDMHDDQRFPDDTKQVFRQCGTCSRTFAHLLNRAFENTYDAEERAIDPLAGGILQQGHQCGMLWGAALAVGAEAFRRTPDPEKATSTAIAATQAIIASFHARSKTINCREVTGVDMRTLFGTVRYALQVMLDGMDNSICFNLAEDWAPEAIRAADDTLKDPDQDRTACNAVSCASVVATKLGATSEESTMVAGFAGGLGLSGHGCGALAAAIWMQTLKWCREHPGKNPPMFRNPGAKKILKAFRRTTGGELICEKITGKRFASVEEHTAFIQNNGCAHIIDLLTTLKS